MVETIVPVVHGIRSWIVSLIAFASGALLTAAAVGLALGVALPTGGSTALLAAGLVAVVYAIGELGLVRLPSPQLRRQVPERWRERYPQPVTGFLYGVGLGLGFVTYLPVATLVVVCAGVALVAGPLGGAAVLSGFGIGRACVLAASTWGVRSYECATGRVETMAGWAAGGRLRRANGLALALLGAVLLLAASSATAKAATRLDLGPDPVADPSLGDGDVIAYDEIAGGAVEGKLLAGGTTTDLPGTHPDVDGSRLVVDSGPGFKLVDVGTGAVIRTVPKAGTDPALSGDWLVYRRVASSRREIVAFNLATSETRVIAHSLLRTDLGAPDVSGPRVVFTRTSDRRSRLMLYRFDTRVSRVLREATRAVYAHAEVDARLVAYTRQLSDRQQLLRLNLRDGTGAVLRTQRPGSGRALWTVSVNNWRFAFTLYTATEAWIYEL
jgi:hypothetical protein